LDLQAFANIGEFVGGIAVIVSLVYLAYQVRQNTISLRAENYGRALDRIAAMQSQLSRDSSLAHLFARGVANTASLTPQERIQFTWWFYEAFGAFEFMFHAARSRSLPDEVWTRWSGTVAWWLSYPGVQAWWRNRPAPFTESFSAFVEDVLRDNPTDPAAARRWGDFVAGGPRPEAGADAPDRGEAPAGAPPPGPIRS